MTAAKTNSEAKLLRVLSLSDLIIYGIILIQPVAALPLFAHANNTSKGHAVTAILIAMVAIIFTAISYGRMANRYPSAGSAYTYVGKGLNPHLGFVAGWSMFMDYMFIPILCVIFTSVAANHLLPIIPCHFWIFFFVGGFTLLNLKGIKVASRANDFVGRSKKPQAECSHSRRHDLPDYRYLEWCSGIPGTSVMARLGIVYKRTGQ